MDLSTKTSAEDGPQLKHEVSSVSPTHRESGCLAPDWPAPGGALLELHQVTKVFDGKVVALNGISFQMAKGEFLILAGPNKAGKTTLLRLIASEDRPTEGAILFDRFDSRTIRRKEIPLLRRKMGRIFPDFRLMDHLNVFDNVALSLRILNKKEKLIKRRVPEVLGKVGMLGASRRFPPSLSSAEKQKVAIARALAGDPLLLLADEPTMNLDEESADEIMTLLREVSLLGTAVLMAARHPRRRVGGWAEMLRIDKGRLIKAGIRTWSDDYRLPVAPVCLWQRGR
jgi:cell division transport system ATP-binding protein